MSADQRDPRDEVAPLNAGGSLEELGEGDLEDAAGGACGTFSCTLFRIFGSTAETDADREAI